MTLRIRPLLHAAAALVLGCLSVCAATVPARAANTAPDAEIRAAHFSPTTPGVDVYLGRFSGSRPPTKLWLGKVHYGTVSGYQPLTPGVYTVAMRPAGAPATSRPVLTWTLHARPHAAYTVAGVGAGASVRGVVVDDNLSAPPPGQARVRVIQAASRAPVADVRASGGHVISPAVHFASVSDYRDLPAGRLTVHAASTSDAAEAASTRVTVRSGQVTSILLLDAKSHGITLRTILDSAAAGVVPSSAVPAGGGGMATQLVDRPTGRSTAALLGTGAILLVTAGALAAGIAGTRRRRPRRAA